MENVNQVAYLMFAAFTLGLAIKSYFEFNNQNIPAQLKFNWAISLFFLLLSNIFVAIGTTGLYAFLFLGNTLAVVALLKMGLFFRAIYRPVTVSFTRRVNGVAFIFVCIFGVLFIEKAPYLYRFYLFSSVFILVTLWHLDELWDILKKEKTLHIKAIFYLKLALLLLCFVRTITAFDVFEGHIQYVYEEQANGLLARLILTALNLATFVMVGGYISEKILLGEKALVTALNLKIEELKQVTHEKDEVKEWLAEREKLIESLIKSQKMAETGVLSASIAHELSQPLCAIQMNAQCLAFILKEHDDDAMKQALLERIIADNARASEIIASLKLIFTSSKNQFERVSLDELIKKVGVIVLPSATMKNIQLHFDLALGEEIFLCVSEFQQVIINLLNNAIEAFEGVDNQDKDIHISTRRQEERVRIVVRDNGPGIASEIGDGLFDLMKTSKSEGMGIGLWLSRHIVKRHKGALFYENGRDGGVSFIIDIPLIQ